MWGIRQGAKTKPVSEKRLPDAINRVMNRAGKQP